MKTAAAPDLLARLALQVDSLQEGFDLLAHAGTVKDMARRLFQLLRGALTTVEAHFFLREREGGGWTTLFGKGTAGPELLSGLSPGPSFSAHAVDHASVKLVALQPLLDGCCLAVALGPKLVRRAPYTEQDQLTLQIFLQLFANAYQAFLLRRK